MITHLSMNFTIGTADGEYPAGSTITDSIFEYCTISSITGYAQSYNYGFSVNKRTLNLGFAANNGDKLTINFKHPVTIQ